MFAIQLAAAILLCACAANGLLEQGNNLFERKDLNVNLFTPTLDTFRPLYPGFKNLRKDTFRPTLGFKNSFFPLRQHTFKPFLLNRDQTFKPFFGNRDHTFKDLNHDNFRQDFNLDNFRHDFKLDNCRHDFKLDNFRQDLNLDNFRHDFKLDNFRQDLNLDNFRQDFNLDNFRQDFNFDNSRQDFNFDNLRQDFNLDTFRPDFRSRNLLQNNKFGLDLNLGFNGQDVSFRLSLLKKLVFQLDGFLKFERQLLVTGHRQEARQVFREVTKQANAALLLAKEARVPHLLYNRLYEVFTLSRSVETLVDQTLETRVLFRQLERLDNLVKNAETLLLVPVDTSFDNLLE